MKSLTIDYKEEWGLDDIKNSLIGLVTGEHFVCGYDARFEHLLVLELVDTESKKFYLVADKHASGLSLLEEIDIQKASKKFLLSFIGNSAE